MDLFLMSTTGFRDLEKTPRHFEAWTRLSSSSPLRLRFLNPSSQCPAFDYDTDWPTLLISVLPIAEREVRLESFSTLSFHRDKDLEVEQAGWRFKGSFALSRDLRFPNTFRTFCFPCELLHEGRGLLWMHGTAFLCAAG